MPSCDEDQEASGKHTPIPSTPIQHCKLPLVQYSSKSRLGLMLKIIPRDATFVLAPVDLTSLYLTSSTENNELRLGLKQAYCA